MSEAEFASEAQKAQEQTQARISALLQSPQFSRWDALTSPAVNLRDALR